MLLKSCAMPPARWPTACLLSACLSRAPRLRPSSSALARLEAALARADHALVAVAPFLRHARGVASLAEERRGEERDHDRGGEVGVQVEQLGLVGHLHGEGTAAVARVPVADEAEHREAERR